ncbi:MAG: hypothetical protein MJ252_24790 [archaeon]|nr:hypothetical protein [archaeon]
MSSLINSDKDKLIKDVNKEDNKYEYKIDKEPPVNYNRKYRAKLDYTKEEHPRIIFDALLNNKLDYYYINMLRKGYYKDQDPEPKKIFVPKELKIDI